MKNKEIEELLNKLRKCRDYDDEVLLIKQYGATLLLSYIEHLENNRDKAIEYIEKHTDKLKNIIVPNINFDYKELLNKLKGGSDDK